jgi:hypothetical protein
LPVIAAAGVVLALASKATASDAVACVRLDAPSNAPALWREAIDELRARLAHDAAGCTPTSLSIVVTEPQARIVATTADGRTTERTVHRPDALVATALGLTASIPPDEPRPPAPTTSHAPTPRETPPPAPALGLSMGLSAGVRLTAPTAATALDLEARADFEVGSWLVLATVRAAPVSCLGLQGLDCDAYSDVGGGIGLGRKFRAGATALDLAFEPLVLAMHMEYDADNEDEDLSVEGTEVALFLDLSGRLDVPLGHGWALTVTVDGAVAPTVVAKPLQLPLPSGASSSDRLLPFPAWMGGVRVGAMGTLL